MDYYIFVSMFYFLGYYFHDLCLFFENNPIDFVILFGLFCLISFDRNILQII